MTQSEKNISRLVKLADDSNKPGRAFTESLIYAAISELRWLGLDRKQEEKAIIAKVSWQKKVVGLAATIALVCGAGLSLLVSILIQINSFFALIVLIVTFFNWLTYLGGLIL